MKDVIVTVVGTQRDVYGEESNIELMTLGRCYIKKGVNYIIYRETEISGMEGTTTMLKVYSEYVEVVRTGSLKQKLEFRPSIKTKSSYMTPFGCMEMQVFTKQLELVLSGVSGIVNIHYELEINGQWQSENTLSVTIREEQHGR